MLRGRILRHGRSGMDAQARRAVFPTGLHRGSGCLAAARARALGASHCQCPASHGGEFTEAGMAARHLVIAIAQVYSVESHIGASKLFHCASAELMHRLLLTTHCSR
jgi:hypothetical protein